MYIRTEATAAPSRRRIKFNRANTFQKDLNARVQRYFQLTGRPERDCARMYLKTAIIALWFISTYVLLVFYASAWWIALPLAASLGLAVAAVGFNIQHDGGHRAYSRHNWVNKVMATTLDLMGGSSFIWARKHNTMHHTHTNITGHDDDIDVGVLGRFSPHDKHRAFHRFQHYYLWPLYGFLPIKWHLLDDFRDVARGRIGEHRFNRPKGWDLVVFIGGKVFFFGMAFVLPAFFHPLWVVLLFYVLVCLIQGMVLSTVFQMAHVVEEADFPMPDQVSGEMDNQWAIHQVETTVNFAPRNRLLSWYVGGLNYQVEHHLFPRICHIHYPKIARIVERACRRAGVKYNSHETLFGSLRSHFRWLREMGRPQPAV